MKYLRGLLLSVVLFHPQFVLANVGITLVASGTVEAVVTADEVREIKRRSNIFETDTVTTGAESKAQFRMKDGAMIALIENTEWQVVDYKYQEAGEDAVAMQLIKGGLRTISGQVGKADNTQYKLDTPVGSIGIRGTHYEVRITDDGQLLLAVYEGMIVIETDQGTYEVGSSVGYAYAVVDANGNLSYLDTMPAEFTEGHSLSKTDIQTLIDSGQFSDNVVDVMQRLDDIDSFSLTEKPEEPLENSNESIDAPTDAEILLDFNDIVGP